MIDRNPPARNWSLSQARTAQGALQIVHHATKDLLFSAGCFAGFSHFGTRHAARSRIHDWADARLVSAILDIRAPLDLPDVDDLHGIERLLDLIQTSGRCPLLDADARSRVEQAEQEAGEGFDELAEILEASGFDGIRYVNRHEDPGSLSWIILRPDQVTILRDGRAGDSHDPWELSLDRFVGPAMVSPMFDIDGRDENYDHLWEEMDVGGREMPVLARDADGWEARWLWDWEPEATMGLFDPEGSPQGFYMSGQLWIEDGARGHGRSALMILGAADLLGDCPTQNRSGLGFSPAGHAAHVAAWNRSCEEGRERGRFMIGQVDPNDDDDTAMPLFP